ncbi:MAG: hypothetical protein IPJ65_22130 [Archangiaceae bacterium]|nr:hypothetical protein [Archangiaceae bacterium]
MPQSKDPHASCSDDLALARRLSLNLTGARPAASPPAPAAAPPAYARFAPPPRPSAPAAPAVPPTFRVPPASGVGQEGWNRLLREVQAFSGALGVFVIDASGLMVASGSTQASREELEAVGSRLLVALEQADRISGAPGRSVAVDLGERVLTGVRVRAADGVTVTLALVTRAALAEPVRAALYQLLPEQPAA